MGIYCEKAAGLFKSGYCCSQAVACAFADKLGDDADVVKADVEGYRGGRKGYCGAVLGARTVANYLRGVKDRDDPAGLLTRSDDISDLITDRFRERIGEDQCAAIKGKKLRSCLGCVEDAASVLEELLEEGKV